MGRTKRRGQLSRVVVVDTDVVSAANSRPSRDPRPIQCAKVLRAILEICHRVVWTSFFKEEWSRHRSEFAAQWYYQMRNRRKLVEGLTEDPGFERSLRKGIAALPASRREVAEKDLPLVMAALAADHVILSLDKPARLVYSHLASDLPVLRSITWVNPEVNDCLVWLQEGAPAWHDCQLGFKPGDS